MKILQQLISNDYEAISGYQVPGLVTVIVSAYNHEKFVAQALASIQAQSYRPIEIVFFDDGSADQTFERAGECLMQGTIPFRAIKKANQGSCVSALNHGICFSHGEFIAILSADDCFTEDKLWLSVEKLVTSDADLVLGPISTWRRMVESFRDLKQI